MNITLAKVTVNYYKLHMIIKSVKKGDIREQF